jgi:hypothetical protein
MALPAIIDSLDSVPEAIRGHYVAATDGDIKGKFVLGVEERNGFRLDNPAPLRSSLEHAREDVRKAKEALKAFGDLTPDGVRDLQAQIEKLKGGVQKDQLQAMLDAELSKHRQTWDGERKGLEGKSTRLDKMLRKTLVDAAAADALTKAGVKPNMVRLLVNELRGIADVEIPDADDGSPRVYLKNEAGGRRTTHRQGQTGDMSIEEWASDFARKDYPDAFDAGGASGGGKNGSGARQGGGAFTISLADAKDPAKYRRVADEAAKAGQTLTIVP